jgi:hypothetical protein
MLAMPRLTALVATLLLSVTFAVHAPAQAPGTPVEQAPATVPAEPPKQDQPQPAQALDPTTVDALDSLAKLLAQKREDLAAAQKSGDAAHATALNEEIQHLSWQFSGLAARFDVQEFEAPREGKFDLQKELEQLIRPLLQTVKDATATPRQVADMKARLDALESRQRTADAAKRAVERTRDLLPEGSPARAEAVNDLKTRWSPMLEGLRSEVLVLQAGIKSRAENQKSMLESVTQTLQKFVQESGLSLLLSALVFVSVFFSLRWLQNRVLRARSSERGFALRLFETVFSIGSILIAVIATMVVPYVRNDWLLLAVGIVFLVGVGWVLVRMAPRFFEQIRLVLNVGAVREGERLVLDGLPYRVDQLRFYSRLHNPNLQGGTLRIPIQDLLGKCSRRSGPDEPWFPSHTGDYVALADGTFGQVLQQTPSVVVIDYFGAARTYPTLTYLAQNPRNLSQGFTTNAVFGIDYRHQAEATLRIPTTLHEALAEELPKVVPAGALHNLDVQFTAANTSSLDYTILATFNGDAAKNYLDVQRAIQRICTEACTHHGWHIPFPQVVVHRADA